MNWILSSFVLAVQISVLYQTTPLVAGVCELQLDTRYISIAALTIVFTFIFGVMVGSSREEVK